MTKRSGKIFTGVVASVSLFAMGLQISSVNAQTLKASTSLNKSLVQEASTDFNGNAIFLKPTDAWKNASDEQLPSYLSAAYGLKSTSGVAKTQVINDGEMEHTRFNQVIDGIEIIGADVVIHRNLKGEITGITGSMKQVVGDVNPSFSTTVALQTAMRHIGENQPFSWMDPDQEFMLREATGNPNASYYPQPRLVYAPINGDFNGEYVLAYRSVLQVGGENPSRWVIDVNAVTGEVINHYNSIHTVAAIGTGSSLYSGSVSIGTDLVSNVYYMRDVTRKVETYNMNNGTQYNRATLFSRSTNTWSATAERAGVDAHFGASQTYDYFKNVHGRNSFDGNGATIKSYVHYSRNYNNAYWNGSVMTYGDGDGTTFTPLVTVDVAGHEITHAVTERTAGLVYQNESGALNEAWSDIFGTAVEFQAYGSNGNWLVGEDCYTPNTAGDALRSMSNPNAEGQPDTYQGTMWYSGTGDNGGVHYNSGVANHWFYLLSVGGSGVNDKGTSYSVTGIGIAKAARVAYVALASYMTSSTNYAGARTATLNAATQLYGASSAEVTQVGNAWTAVGVGGTSGGGGTTPPPTTFTEVNEAESNNSISAANLLPASPVAVTGKVSTTSDNDYFRITIGAGKSMVAKLKVPSTKDYDLYVYNSAGTQVASSLKGTGVEETITVTNSGTSAVTIYWRVAPYKSSSTSLTYRLELYETSSVAGIAGTETTEESIETFVVHGNYPNPFNPTTNISFFINESMPVTVEVFNVLGQSMGVLFNEVAKAGKTQITWNASGVPSGTYLYKITADGLSKFGKMTLTK